MDAIKRRVVPLALTRAVLCSSSANAMHWGLQLAGLKDEQQKNIFTVISSYRHCFCESASYLGEWVATVLAPREEHELPEKETLSILWGVLG
eukprot:1890001-Amphidinium_carterae.1